MEARARQGRIPKVRILAKGRSPWGPLAIIATLLGIMGLIIGFVIFGPPMFSSAYGDGQSLTKYANNSNAGNDTVIAAGGINSLFVGFYSGPLKILSLIVGVFLIVAALAFAVAINRRKKVLIR